jgi:hypothetical protein
MVTWRGDQILEVAVSAVKAQNFERAAELCVQAIKVKPELAEAWHIRGICLLRQQRFFDALLHFDRALEIREDMADCWNNRGIAFAEIGMWESAQDSFQRSLSMAKTVEPHVMCGGMFAHLMQLEAAEKEFAAALEIEPDLHDAHIKRGVILLGMGRWKEGFPEYAWRWYDTPYPPRAWRSFPTWDGHDMSAGHRGTAETLLVYSEQGYGDEIMSLRFVDMIRHLAARLIVEVRPTMKRLAEGSLGVEVIAAGDTYPDGIDYSCPLLDVPMVLGMTPEALPQKIRYLHQPRVPAEIIGRMPEGFKVGLCWSSGRRPLQPETERSASAKSIPLEMLRPLMDTGAKFVSLQLPRAPIPRGMPIVDFTDYIDDMKHTAEIVAGLDLVISVDTAIAHLAGALGVPVWNLVRFNGYWPWMRETDKTVWYPSMRIFRQPALGDWESVIGRVRERLVDAVGERAP